MSTFFIFVTNSQEMFDYFGDKSNLNEKNRNLNIVRKLGFKITKRFISKKYF